jgi:hypothetical protein
MASVLKEVKAQVWCVCMHVVVVDHSSNAPLRVVGTLIRVEFQCKADQCTLDTFS